MMLKIAIVENNTLAVLGLKQLLQAVIPVMDVDTFGTFAELEQHSPDAYVHYFISVEVLQSHRAFFAERRRKTIVLTPEPSADAIFEGFHCLSFNQPEHELTRTIIHLQQYAHSGGRHLPPMEVKELTKREIEVMKLIVKGYINKEIADKLYIGLSTVVTHRKNIMEKLGLKSVSALTIYAVTHGYVSISEV
jgi:DNA-binding NarL/FixJ family response regulator